METVVRWGNTDEHEQPGECAELRASTSRRKRWESAPRRKCPEEESCRGDHYRLQGVHSGPRGSIQAQRVLVVAPEDTVSGSKRPSMVVIDVALRKQPRATARGEF